LIGLVQRDVGNAREGKEDCIREVRIINSPFIKHIEDRTKMHTASQPRSDVPLADDNNWVHKFAVQVYEGDRQLGSTKRA
jgi:hypothetical protein